MDHVAIMHKNAGWLEKILCGEKTIESRWYKTRKAPYGRISPGDTIYFKESGMPISVKAEAEHILVFNKLNEKSVKYILRNYAKEICIPKSYDPKYLDYNYAILVFLKNITPVRPFDIDKKGYGNNTSWITLEDIDDIKVKKEIDNTD